MITVLRAYGLAIAIYSHDHEPPHVHVVGDGTVKILLFGRGGRPQIMHVAGMRNGDIRKALKVVAEYQDMLLEMWRRIHG